MHLVVMHLYRMMLSFKETVTFNSSGIMIKNFEIQGILQNITALTETKKQTHVVSENNMKYNFFGH